MLGPPRLECLQCQCQWEARRRLSEPGSPTTSADSRSLQRRYWLVCVQCRRLSRCTPDHPPHLSLGDLSPTCPSTCRQTPRPQPPLCSPYPSLVSSRSY